MQSREPLTVEAAGLRQAAVALVMRDGVTGIELLFIRRAEDPQDPWSGHIGFPGGRVEPSDAGFREAAARETLEEVGIDLARGEFLGALDPMRAVARMRPVDLVIAPFAWRLAEDQPIVASPEVASAHWLQLDELLDPAREDTMEYEHAGAMLRFPCLRVGGLVIWGLTFRMFTELAERLRSADAGGLAAAATT
jgi:8-oxo-dGTP pyrophosphatase MutT (NUDIX family)